LVSH
jgi:hypothetical protein